MRPVRLFAVGLVLAPLGACATPGEPSRPLPPPLVVTNCPPLKSYTPAQEQAMAASLAALSPGDPLVGAMADYGALRAAVRACR